MTRKTVWVDQETNETHTERETWDTAWAIAGLHSFKWWWVKRWGSLDCGCQRNPLTRRMTLFRWGCPEHMPKRDLEDD